MDFEILIFTSLIASFLFGIFCFMKAIQAATLSGKEGWQYLGPLAFLLPNTVNSKAKLFFALFILNFIVIFTLMALIGAPIELPSKEQLN